MIKYENQCVGCPKEIGCFGSSCPFINVPIYYCDNDNCGNYAAYKIENMDFCEDCADEYFKTVFDELTISEKAETLEIKLERIDD